MYLPNTPMTMKMHAQTAANIEAARGYTTTAVIVLMSRPLFPKIKKNYKNIYFYSRV